MFQMQSPMMMSQQAQRPYQPFQGPSAGPPPPAPNPMMMQGNQQQQNPMIAKLQAMGMQKMMGGMPGANPMGQSAPGTSANPINWNDGAQQSNGIDWNNQRPPMPAGADGTPAFQQQNFFPSWLTGKFQR